MIDVIFAQIKNKIFKINAFKFHKLLKKIAKKNDNVDREFISNRACQSMNISRDELIIIKFDRVKRQYKTIVLKSKNKKKIIFSISSLINYQIRFLKELINFFSKTKKTKSNFFFFQFCCAQISRSRRLTKIRISNFKICIKYEKNDFSIVNIKVFRKFQQI